MQALRPTCQLVRVNPARAARGLLLVGLLAGGAPGCSRSERAPPTAANATAEPQGSPLALPLSAAKSTAEPKVSPLALPPSAAKSTAEPKVSPLALPPSAAKSTAEPKVSPLALPPSAAKSTAESQGSPLALPVAPELLRARQQFRAEQDGRMRGELSPLARIDYVHLPQGEHLVGSGDRATVRLDPQASAGAAEVRLRVDADGTARRLAVQARPAIARNGIPVTTAVLVSGDVLALGRLRLLVAGLPDDPAVALYDPAAPARQGYRQLLYYPDDERFVTRGRLVRYPTPRAVRLDASRGEPRPLLALGTLHFTLAGTAASLEAYSDSPATNTAPAQLFLIFKDATNGKPEGSYGAGRFLTPRLLAGDEVVLDFNQAWNPLCAYSPYFHCPLPPRRNWLPLAIPAGERAYAAH